MSGRLHDEGYVAGASAAIMKTVTEIEAIIKGKTLSPAGPKRRKLRSELRSVIVRASKRWYKRGFKRGHMESFRSYKQTGRVPIKLLISVNREFIPDASTSVVIKSSLSKAFRTKVSRLTGARTR
jgi:hypothetical protein